MEYHQQVQERTAQTVPVITAFAPSLKIEKKGAAELQADATGLTALAQGRDNALFSSDEAVRGEYAGFFKIRLLGLKIPALIEALLGPDDPAVDSLDTVYAITPRTTEAAVERAQALRPVWVKANAQRAAMTPPELPIARNGVDLAALDALLAAQPALEQTVKNTAQAVKGARHDLRLAAAKVDQLNKRFYKALVAQADPGSALENALTGITTESANLPETLSIAGVLQGGTDQLHLLVSYDAATFDPTVTNTLEWMVVGVDAEFTKSVAADPSGNALGPFAVGQPVKLRTRTSNANGSTTGSVRTVTVTAPII